MMHRLRVDFTSNKRSAGGWPMIRVGMRVGFWPCLHAPFVEIDVVLWRVSIWWGLPSYKR